MNKQLVSVAAVAAMAAGGALAVESQNIVGFQDITAGIGYNYVTPSFTTVGANTYKLGDITLSGDDVEEYGDNVQIFDPEGACDMQFYWTADGWFDMGGYLSDDPNDLVLERGMFAVVDIQNDGDVTAKVSGQVCTNGFNVAAVAGYNYVGNPTQTTITLGDITLSGDDVEEYGDNIQIFDADGACDMQFYWTADGWFDMGGYLSDDPNDYQLTPGQGVVVDIQNDGDVTIAVAGKFVPGL